MPEPEQEETEKPTPEAGDPKLTDAPPTVVAEEPKDQAGKTVQLKHSDFKKIKDEAKDKGRREALDELDAAAVKVGFKSMSEALEHLGDLKKKITAQLNAPTQQPQERPQMPKPPTPQAKPPVPANKVAEKEALLNEEKSKLRKQWKREERARRELQRQLDAKEARVELFKELSVLGVTDFDFMEQLIVRELAGKSVEEVGKFDRKAFVEGQRGSRPFLFGERVVPANTGTAGPAPGGATPAPPAAGQPSQQAAQEKRFDGMKATRQEYEAHLTKMGLNPNHA